MSDEPTPDQTKVRKPRKPREPKTVKAKREPRADIITSVLGTPAHQASKALSRDQRRELIAALRAQAKPERVEKLKAQIGKLQDKLTAFGLAVSTVSSYVERLEKIESMTT